MLSANAEPNPQSKPYFLPKVIVFLRHMAPIGPMGMPTIKPISIPLNKFMNIKIPAFNINELYLLSTWIFYLKYNLYSTVCVKIIII